MTKTKLDSQTKMPSTSKKQARTMAAAAHNPAIAKKVGIPVKVAKEFNQADMRMAQGPTKSDLKKGYTNG